MASPPESPYNLVLSDLGQRCDKTLKRMEDVLLRSSSLQTRLEAQRGSMLDTVASAFNSVLLEDELGDIAKGESPESVLTSQIQNREAEAASLREENRGLVTTLDEYQVAMDLLMQRHRNYKEHFEQEMLKVKRQEPIEALLAEEKQLNEQLREENSALHQRVQSMFDVIRRAAAEEELDEEDMDSYTMGLLRENETLREILQLSQLDNDALLSSADAAKANDKAGNSATESP